MNNTISLPYDELKSRAVSLGATIQYVESTDEYRLFVLDGAIQYQSILYRAGSSTKGIDTAAEAINVADFETNHKDKTINIFADGHLIEIAAGQSTVTVNVTYAEQTYLLGVKVITEDSVYGDVGEFTLQHPDPQVGEIKRFGNNCYLPTGKHIIEVKTTGQGTPVPAGIIYRTKLTAADTNGRKVIVWLILRK